MLHIGDKIENGKNEKRARRLAIAGGALALVGMLALICAVLLCARADAVAREEVELINALALFDVRERLSDGARTLGTIGSADADDDARRDATRARLLEALEEISAVKAMLSRVGWEAATSDAAQLLEACRADILDALKKTDEPPPSVFAEWKERLEKLCAVLGEPTEAAAEELSDLCAEAEIADDEGVDRGYDGFNIFSTMTDEALEKKAAEYFGAHAVLTVAHSRGFPPAMVLAGKNTYIALSRARGELLELYFDRPPGEECLTEAECARIAMRFLENERLPVRHLSAESCERDELCGAYYYNVGNSAEKRNVRIGVRWDTGRICYFNAYEYYR